MSLDGQLTKTGLKRFYLDSLKEETLYCAEVEKDKDATEYNPEN